MYRIGKYSIDPRVLDALPESLAREEGVLPIGPEPGELRVLIAVRPEKELRAALRRISFVTGLAIRYTVAERDKVAAMVDELFTPKTVDNCDVQFEFECPKNWLTMRPTQTPAVRYCEACERPVYFCKDEAEVKQHTMQGDCVAVTRLDEYIDVGLAKFQD